MDRRGFLRLLSMGAAATAAGIVLVEPEPVRRYWQVPRNAPVGRADWIPEWARVREWEGSLSATTFAPGVTFDSVAAEMEWDAYYHAVNNGPEIEKVTEYARTESGWVAVGDMSIATFASRLPLRF